MDNRVWNAGGFVFTRSFNPVEPDYNPFEVEEHFQGGQRDQEFIAWRELFYPNQSRCDYCFIHRLPCEITYNEYTLNCELCQLSGRQCLFTSITQASNPVNQSPLFLPAPAALPNTTLAQPILLESPAMMPGIATTEGADENLFGEGSQAGTNNASIPHLPNFEFDFDFPMPDIAIGDSSGNPPLPNKGMFPADNSTPGVPDENTPAVFDFPSDDNFAGINFDIPHNNTLVPGFSLSDTGVSEDPAFPASDGFAGNFSNFPNTSSFRQNENASVVPLPMEGDTGTDLLNLSKNIPNEIPLAIPDFPAMYDTPQPSDAFSQAGTSQADASNSKRRLSSDEEIDEPSSKRVKTEINKGFSGGIPEEVAEVPIESRDSLTLPNNNRLGPSNFRMPSADDGPLSQSNQPSSSLNQPNASAANPPWISHREFGRIPFSGKNKIRCRLCSSFVRDSLNWRNCNWSIDTVTGEQKGCSRCSQWGLCCVVEDIALPPRPGIGLLRSARFSRCTNCKDHGSKCDRASPCECCVTRNDPNCARISHQGTFPRGAGVATEIYPYLSAMKGGPGGMGDPDIFRSLYNLPRDFHVQFTNWLAGGDLPLPPGYKCDAALRTPARPQLELRTLPFGLPPLPGPGPSPTPRPLASGSAPAPASSSIPRSTEPGSHPIVIPPGDEFRISGLHGTMLYRLAPELQAPPSPGPTLTIFDLTHALDISAYAELPITNPERASTALVRFPPPRHPNPTSTPALRTVPYPSNPTPDTQLSCLEHKAEGLCNKPTTALCEDISHTRDGIPICTGCNDASRQVIESGFQLIATSMRAYACFDCSQTAATDPAKFNGKRFNVWGLQPNALEESHPDDSRNMGCPLPMTGCYCAAKLLSGTLCGPHRLEHFLDIHHKVSSMRNYVLHRAGRSLCPFCQTRVGVDAYNFTDGLDVPFLNVTYVCLSCLGIVVLDHDTHASLGHRAHNRAEANSVRDHIQSHFNS
ncbi:hypothetical protein GGS24DRAFT_509705 [Hypoxylon argillaceum]|nr:hypothetical protein GGS24DRAFT_509705 [Hypoxylon argillaceum]